MFQRCLLKHKLTHAISSLSPAAIKIMKAEVLKNRFNLPVLFLHDYCWISTAAAYNAEKQYNTLIKNADFLTEAKKFSINDDRVDAFYARIFDSRNTVDLENIVKLVLIFSYVNAKVELEFSIKDVVFSSNMLG